MRRKKLNQIRRKKNLFSYLHLWSWNLRLHKNGRIKRFELTFPTERENILRITPYDVKRIIGQPDAIFIYRKKRTPPGGFGRNEFNLYAPVIIDYMYRRRIFSLNFIFYDDTPMEYYTKERFYTKKNLIRYHMEMIRKTTFDYYKNYKCDTLLLGTNNRTIQGETDE